MTTLMPKTATFMKIRLGSPRILDASQALGYGPRMQCVVCELPLITVEIHDVELDYCADGHGQWLDEGELEALMDAHEPVLHFETDGEDSPRRCPRCVAPMKVHRTKSGIELDLCPRADGMWFDHGELRALAKELEDDRTPDELDYLADAFSKLGQILGD